MKIYFCAFVKKEACRLETRFPSGYSGYVDPNASGRNLKDLQPIGATKRVKHQWHLG